MKKVAIVRVAYLVDQPIGIRGISSCLAILKFPVDIGSRHNREERALSPAVLPGPGLHAQTTAHVRLHFLRIGGS